MASKTKHPYILVAGIGLALLAGCSARPVVPVMERAQGPAPTIERGQDAEQEVAATASRAMLAPGTGELINREAATFGTRATPVEDGVMLNFEGESVHALVQTILGEMLQQNYVIAPGVSGSVTLATPRPVSQEQAFALMEAALAWNGARVLWTDGRYMVVPDEQAIPGNLAPRIGGDGRGFELRAVPLRFISAREMEKLLRPYATERAFVSVDNARNLLVLAGTRGELQNYLRTVSIFDVDWLAGMSVGIFPLQSADAERVVSQLERLFGEEGESPLAGMFRFIPLEGVNSVLVITPQPKYLRDIETWLERMDQGGQGARLYVYEVNHSRASSLAEQLSAVFGGGGSGTGSRRDDRSALAPGVSPRELRSPGSSGRGGGARGASAQGGGVGAGGRTRAAQAGGGAAGGGDAPMTVTVAGDGIGVDAMGDVTITAVEENNSLVVRALPSQWESIRRAIERLDVMPLQVHIEAQVLEVTLNDRLNYGVSWFFHNSIQNQDFRGQAAALSGSQPVGGGIGNNGNFAWQILRPNSLAVIEALDQVSDVRVLSSPSLMVRNNVEAQLVSGTRIPVASTSFNPDTGAGGTFTNVQYLDTGVNLVVTPRVSRNGTVFLQIEQSVSSVSETGPTVGENVSVDNRDLVTEVAVQSGDTVLIAGLIREESANTSAGVPGLSRLPVVGGLFGQKSRRTLRQEVVVLITPRVVTSNEDARNLTDEYGRRFRALEPLRRP